jgi:hypothetical protein
MTNESELNAERLYKKFLHNVESILGNQTTFSTDLNRVGKSLLKSKFAGVFPADQIPKLTKRTPYAIANLDTSDESGSHWIALARKDGKVYFYDSFGRPDKSILPLLGKSGNGVVVDTDHDREQGFAETNCGARSMAWLLLFDKYGVNMAMKI